MAKNKYNTAPPINTKPTGLKMRNGANKTVEPSPEVKRVRTPEEIKKRNGIIITVIAAILIVAIVASVTAVIVAAILKGDSIDYLKDNLTGYIKLSRDDYTGLEIDIPLMEYSDEMVTAEINKLIVKHKSEDALADGTGFVDKPVDLGDEINYRYRIYYVDENGKETEIPGYCNFNDKNLATLVIGSQNRGFLGFEESLIGVVPSDYKEFKKIKAGTVSAGDVIYVSCTAFYPGGAAGSKSYERVDLSRDDVDDVWGEGFRNFIIGEEIGTVIGSKTFPTSDGSIGYSDLKVEFATQCETDALTFDVVFAANHSDGTEIGKTLRDTAARIDVYIDSVVKYDTPEYNAEFITKTLGISEDELSAYDGDTVAKHKAFVKATVEKNVAKTNEALISEAIWEKISDKGEIKKYPKGEYDRIFGAYSASVENYYNQYAEERGYSSVDAAAIDYLELESGADWQAYLKGVTESEIHKDLVLYYIIRKEGFIPTDKEYDEEYNELLSGYVEYYLEKHADEFEKFEGAEYDEQLKILTDEIKGIYGPTINYNVYKNILLRKMQNDTEFVTIK